MSENRASEDSRRLAENEARFRALITATSDVVFRMNADWSRMQRLDGRDFADDILEPSSAWLDRYVPPDEHARVMHAVQAAIASRTVFELEHRVIRPDGRIGWTFSRAVPIFGADGEIVEWFGAASDVTRRKLAEEQVAQMNAESERRRRLYETILSNTPDLVYVFDLDHRFVYANEVLLRMWGRTWDEAIGRNCLELGYEPWHAAMHDREIEQVKATKQPIRGEVPFTGTFGRRIYDYIFVPVMAPDGEVEAIAGTTRDVTERKQAEEAMERLVETLRAEDRHKDEFIAILAHELRNPISAVHNALQIMKLAPDNPGSVKLSSQIVERQVTHVARLIDDLLDVSRITAGKITLDKRQVDVADVVKQGIDAAQSSVRAGGHRVSVTLPEQPLYVEGDVVRLAQVVGNLVGNAAKYSPEPGDIAVVAEADGDSAVIRVTDRGIGMAPETLPKLFTLFMQAETALSRAHGGLGVGLALVQRLVALHGGSVDAASAGLGRGSAFTVRLPRLVERAQVATGHESAVQGRLACRAVVVEDNHDVAQSLATLLSMLDVSTSVAYDGLAGLALIEEQRPDVAIVDIGMPGMNGYEVANRVRDRAWGRRIMLVALTGWGQDEDKRRAYAAGFDVHMVKPVALPDLQALLARVNADARPSTATTD